MDWDTFARKVKSCQRGFMGEPDDLKRGKEFHEFPDSCICEKPFTEKINEAEVNHHDLQWINSQEVVEKRSLMESVKSPRY